MKSLLLAVLFLASSLNAAPKPHPLGWKSDPTHAKGLTQIRNHPRWRVAPLPASASVEASLPPVYDQLDLGSCVANAGAAAFDANWHARTGKFVYPSRLDLYQGCLKHDGSYPNDTGTYTTSALWVLTHRGVMLERNWPYKPERLGATPNPGGQRAIYAAVKVFDVPNDDGGFSVRQTIANAKLPVMAGGYVYNQIFSVSRAEPFIAMPRGSPVGGHEILFIAYDDTMEYDGQRGFVKIRNSWGEWGDRGTAWMPYAYAFNSRYFEDFGAVEVTGKRVAQSAPASSPSRQTSVSRSRERQPRR